MSSMSSSSNITSNVRCKCRGTDNLARLWTSWTNNNPGRRIFACKKYNRGVQCGFFCWDDPPMCSRSKAIIPGLLREKNKLELEIANLKKQNLKLKILLGLSCFLWGSLLIVWIVATVKGKLKEGGDYNLKKVKQALKFLE
ncbi:hypothetical protein BUALT_Bualt04G0089400 [Buddleja alternifolia]|uniref:GRF-type domain-containing protein n=1 Tax=Buddleja alternifolia TaxID=168488 RepID=A0AAV6XME2_9LAMI|nr:hypothetical protein BUALT_Bualt04G0089400 [Buddleja alternifolia]